MVSGEFSNGDYFIDSSVLQSVGRAIFGAWIIICVTIIGICARSIYRSRLKRRLLTSDSNKQQAVSLWVVSPASTPSETFEIRNILSWALSKREFSFIFTSLACVFLAVIGAASTAIANQTVVSNVLTRVTPVRGQLATNSTATIQSLGFATVEMETRIKALDNASAPPEELFDFVPDDTYRWLYRVEHWNNSWHGNCTYSFHGAVDLTIFPTNSTLFQDEVPALGALLPPWASANSTLQGAFHSGVGDDNYPNKSIVWQDVLVTEVYLSGAPSSGGGGGGSTFNVSLANFLIDRVGAYPGGGYVQTGFKSDVHVADCMFVNKDPSLGFQATLGLDADDTVNNIAWVYELQTEDASIANEPIIQPTAQQMLRYWQAYTSILTTQFPHETTRNLPTTQAVTQIRLSVVVVTVGVFLGALGLAGAYHLGEPRGCDGRRVVLPRSWFGWVMQAARECQRREEEGGGGGTGRRVPLCSPSTFLSMYDDLKLVVVEPQTPETLPPNTAATAAATITTTRIVFPREQEGPASPQASSTPIPRTSTVVEGKDTEGGDRKGTYQKEREEEEEGQEPSSLAYEAHRRK